MAGDAAIAPQMASLPLVVFVVGGRFVRRVVDEATRSETRHTRQIDLVVERFSTIHPSRLDGDIKG